MTSDDVLIFKEAVLMLAKVLGHLDAELEQKTQQADPTDYKCIGNVIIYDFKGGGDKQQISPGVNGSSELKEDEQLKKNIYKRKDGRYMARITLNGKRLCVYASTQSDALKKLKELEKSGGPKEQTFYEFAVRWLEVYKKNNVCDKTYREYKLLINSKLRIMKTLSKIALSDLQDIVFSIPPSRQRENVYALIKQIYKKAYELGYVSKDISLFLEKGKIPKAERRALNLEEQRKLFNLLGDDTFSMRVLVYLCTGCRPAEFRTMQASEVRLGWVKINGTKTATSVRWVKISEKLSNFLRSQLPQFFKFDLKKFREKLQQLCLKAGISYDVDIYTLRHTFATNLYILRVPEKDRQVYMGHTASSSITNNVYTTFSPDVKADDVYAIYGDFYPKF